MRKAILGIFGPILLLSVISSVLASPQSGLMEQMRLMDKAMAGLPQQGIDRVHIDMDNMNNDMMNMVGMMPVMDRGSIEMFMEKMNRMHMLMMQGDSAGAMSIMDQLDRMMTDAGMSQQGITDMHSLMDDMHTQMEDVMSTVSALPKDQADRVERIMMRMCSLMMRDLIDGMVQSDTGMGRTMMHA